MTEEILLKVVYALGLNPSDILKPKHGSCRSILAIDFITAVMKSESIPQASNLLEVSLQTLNRLLHKWFVPIFGTLNGGNETWKLVFLQNAGLKRCNRCNEILSNTEFNTSSSTFDNLSPICINCTSVKNSIYYKTNKDRYHKPYIAEHRDEYNARNAKRRAQKLNATPTWADIGKIREVYRLCPKGYHVDHIYPLISDWVCGLHVHENLQHLPAKDNISKGNRRVGDW